MKPPLFITKYVEDILPYVFEVYLNALKIFFNPKPHSTPKATPRIISTMFTPPYLKNLSNCIKVNPEHLLSSVFNISYIAYSSFLFFI